MAGYSVGLPAKRKPGSIPNVYTLTSILTVTKELFLQTDQWQEITCSLDYTQVILVDRSLLFFVYQTRFYQYSCR